ncbi:MAG TPA: transposase [Candidatus Limnocylindrales bacterium]|nr:transposase [Candidatus Limnocylindrales bacterium]
MKRFNFYLSRPQQHHFRHLITTMILWVGVHTISQLSQVQRHLWDRDQSNINRFINRAHWQAEWLRKIRWQWVREQIRAVLPTLCLAKPEAPVTGYLVIDDTVVKKTGKKMAGLGWHYCHSEGRKVWGHCYVTALYVIAGFAYPVQTLLYQQRATCDTQGIKFCSKLELAASIIRSFQPVPGTRTVVLFDSWYSSEAVIKAALSRGFKVACALKSNRVVGKSSGSGRVKGSSLKNLAAQSTMEVHLVTVNNHTYSGPAVRRSTQRRLKSQHLDHECSGTG